MNREPTLGPIFVDIGSSDSPEMIDVTQVVNVWIDGDEGNVSFRSDPADHFILDYDATKKLIEEMKKLSPRCNHCGQGTMHCDHCGAPL